MMLTPYPEIFLALASIINSCAIGYVMYHVLRFRGRK